MKTVLRSVLFVALLGLTSKLYSQCTVSNIVIQNVSVVSSTSGSCTVRFDASFNIENNGGNKYIFIHSWIESQYPNYFNCQNGNPAPGSTHPVPHQADLANAFLNIGLDNNGDIPVVLTTYPPDPSVSLNTIVSVEKEVLADGSANIILHGVTTTVPVACGTPVIIMTDLWSSQAAQGQVAHCVNCGIMFAAGYVSVVGLANCANLTFSATLTNRTTTGALSGTYTVYADINGDGHLTPSDTAITSSAPFTIGAGFGTTTTLTGPIPLANLNQDLFLVLTQSTGASTVFLLPSTVCAPLPVTFKSFIATRTNRSNVLLKWETATEINNSGFAIQRNTGNNNWQLVTFIPTQAIGGNSSSILTYTFNDVNTERGMSQYRIRQVDLDGKAKYSDIRAVRGDGQKGKTIVYPNPSFTGSVNVVFENTEGTRDVTLMDLNGRMIKQWKALSGNTIQIDNLGQGIYSLRIVIRETGEQSVEKIVVNKN
jgi:hypothetical protein